MRLWLCGVRGSTPAPGPEFVRYGGHTSCVAIGHDGSPPSLVLDAGTGIRRVGELMNGTPFRGTILLGHLHWDHTQGLPFAPAFDREGAAVVLYQPAQGDPVEVLSRAMAPPHFPIEPRQLRGDWSFEALRDGSHEIEGFSVLALDIPHKGGRTFGYRVSDGRASMAYLSDHWPIAVGPGPDGLGEYHPAVLELCQGVDVILHDAQYTAEELPARADFGHSAIEYAVGLCERAGSRLLLYHHDPNRTDDQLDALVAPWAGHVPAVEAAREGLVVDL
ncbi:MAG: MBL fold metallo-hydrolase [Actinobacteria bacterium]|nr:MBL fold metallo-hydrolase [Actinomycetota bacterium]MBW3649699.1 MBL fold metallo-hydrolase [Actinomycetota bacterium]